MNEQPTTEMPLGQWCNEARGQIEELKGRVRAMRNHSVFRDGEQSRQWQHHDMKANIELALRALEDARMRLGKVIQEMGDGTSIFDKKAK